MKKKLFAIIICLSLVLPVAARPERSYSFLCSIDMSEMPEGAVYVDMLFPLKKTHKHYCEYNEEAGRKTGIPQSGEIVRYETEGFRSYTFHIQNSRSEMKPYKNNDGEFCVSFFEDATGYDGKMFYELDDFGERYKKVKFAYLNAEGDVVAETEEMDIWEGRWYWNLYISISGERAECSMTDVCSLPFEIYLRVMPFAFICFAIWGAASLIKRAQEKRKKKRSL